MTPLWRAAVTAAAQMVWLAVWLVLVLEISGRGAGAIWGDPGTISTARQPLGWIVLFLFPVIFAPAIVGSVWTEAGRRR